MEMQHGQAAWICNMDTDHFWTAELGRNFRKKFVITNWMYINIVITSFHEIRKRFILCHYFKFICIDKFLAVITKTLNFCVNKVKCCKQFATLDPIFITSVAFLDSIKILNKAQHRNTVALSINWYNIRPTLVFAGQYFEGSIILSDV